MQRAAGPAAVGAQGIPLRGNFGSSGYGSSFGSGGQSCLLAFQPGSGGGGGGGSGELSQADVSGFLALGNGNSSGRAIPKETFQQLRQAVLTSLDLADNAEHTIDYEDGSAELAEDILLESCPSAKEVGKSVFETLRIDQAGKTRRVYVRRRDLIRAHGLQPRDLRRVDPSLSPTKVSPSVTIKEECVLLNIGGVRAVVTEDKCLLFEPNSPSSRKFLEVVMPKIQAAVVANQRRAAMKSLRAAAVGGGGAGGAASGSASSPPDDLLGAVVGDSMEGDYYGNSSFEDERIFPFELEMLEGALMVATGKLDAELAAATRRVSSMLQKLPREITPVNLEELRRVKQLLVELESKAENMRDLLEELMDDEEEFIQLNLSSRPRREERRKQRERDRLEREMEREREREADRSDAAAGGGASALKATSRPERIAQLRERLESSSDSGAGRKGGDDEDGGLQDAQDALEEMQEEEEEERELEEVEDLLEYYLQRAANTQSEAERLLAGARDLEESIGVSLSARRFEVNRLELLLSIASFAAALGAMVAGIFGMNLRSTLEMSVVGFWGTTALIILGSYWVFYLIYKYTKRKRIL
ncbi:hypothetical protein ABPG75_010496 [Micractinium tetrahymenae]